MRLGLLALVLLSAACAVSDPGTGPDGSAPSGGADGPGTFDLTETASLPVCPPNAQLVYLLGAEDPRVADLESGRGNVLYRFTPNLGTVEKVGRLACPDTEETVPNSLAIDRKGAAWVNYADGRLFRVDTNDGSCKASRFEPDQAGFLKFGMAFAATGDEAETLFVSGLEQQAGGGKGFGKLDLDTMTMTMLGDYDGELAGRGAELTGTGDGRIFGFFATKPRATLAVVDKAHAGTTDLRPLPGIDVGQAWAFSFWGGDFWFYTSESWQGSKITQLRPTESGDFETLGERSVPFNIVASAVSTCAPTTPPK